MSDLIPLRDVGAWHRFHVRITALYGAMVLGVLTLTAVLASEAVWRTSLEDLRGRMRVTVQALADGMDPRWVSEPDDLGRQAIARRFSNVAGPDPTLTNLYVLRWDPDPTRLSFVLDWLPAGDASSEAARAGALYDGSPFPELLQGFRTTTVETGIGSDAWGPSLSAYAPIPGPDGGPLGLVGVDVRLARLQELRWRIWEAVGLAWVVAVLLIVGASSLVARNVREPLSRLIDGTSRIAAGQFRTRLAFRRNDEFGLLSRHFDRMAEGLEERELIRETFGRYVSPSVARALLAERGTELGGEERDVTVLFCDLRGYSTLSENLAPTAVVTLLNRWLAAMHEAIESTGGTILEFQGDAIIVVFGAPSPDPDHPIHAVQCATAMRSALRALNAERSLEHLPPLAQRIGIHTGPVVAGNIGTVTRTKYTVVGDAVNVAARLEQLNKELGTEVLVSGVTADRLPPGGAELADHGALQVKGRTEPVRVLALAP